MRFDDIWGNTLTSSAVSYYFKGPHPLKGTTQSFFTSTSFSRLYPLSSQHLEICVGPEDCCVCFKIMFSMVT